MNNVLRFIATAAICTATIGCGARMGTTEHKTETKTSHTKDGKTTGESATTLDTTTTTVPESSASGSTVTKKTTETTKESIK